MILIPWLVYSYWNKTTAKRELKRQTAQSNLISPQSQPAALDSWQSYRDPAQQSYAGSETESQSNTTSTYGTNQDNPESGNNTPPSNY
jgi:hypothetical protein